MAGIAWRWLAVAAWSAVILIFTQAGSPWFLRMFQVFVGWTREMHLPDETGAVGFHFLAYAVWAFLLCGAVKGRYWTRLALREIAFMMLLVAAFACAEETLQFLTPVRHPDVFDWGINCLGSAAGLGATYVGGVVGGS